MYPYLRVKDDAEGHCKLLEAQTNERQRGPEPFERVIRVKPRSKFRRRVLAVTRTVSECQHNRLLPTVHREDKKKTTFQGGKPKLAGKCMLNRGKLVRGAKNLSNTVKTCTRQARQSR